MTPAATNPAGAPGGAWQVALALLAVALPPLVAFNEPPTVTFYNQALALFGWGLWLLALAAAALPREQPAPARGAALLLGALALVALAAAAATPLSGVPASLAASAVAIVAAAVLAVAVGATLRAAGRERAAFEALAIALAAGAAGSAVVAIVQVFAPAAADGTWIAVSGTPGRAVGNMRQPNHLASLLLWGLIALAWLADAGRMRRAVALAIGLLLMLGVVLSASRTGIVGALLLAVWAVIDRRLRPRTRIALAAAPVAYAALWLGVRVWSSARDAAFAGAERLVHAGADPSSSRFAIWSDTLELIARVPWTGTGFGAFNYAWSLTPLPERPVAFFDHTHNLPLQLLVELGLPLGLVVLALLGAALVLAARAARREAGPAPVGRAALALVVMIGVHSLLEYPLWYAYFLLPAALAFGLAVGVPAGPPRRTPRLLLAVAGGALALGALAAVPDYRRVAAIFTAPAGAAPLAERIAAGQRSWFFAHHAHYATATIAARPSRAMESFRAATFYLLDTRLMVAWARAYAESGDLERALHLAARLREFRNPDADELFAPCSEPAPPAFPCAPAPRVLDWRDFP